jgi:alpha-galactosidase
MGSTWAGATAVMMRLFGVFMLCGTVAVASITNSSTMPTPPMGFNNWARFMCDLNETLFTTTADAMVSKGLLAAGYNRINLDDCWMQYSRTEDGLLQWNTTLFPRGIPWLADYVKSRGFHFGIYEDSGNLTCGGFPGSLGYEDVDAETFSSWGVDYLKLDGCNVYPEANETMEKAYKGLYGTWHDVLQNMTKPLIFSQSSPAYFSGGPDFMVTKNKSDWYRVMDWVPLYGELARHSQDVYPYGLFERPKYWESIMTNYGYEVLLARYQQPGFFNDPDFIIPDWPELTLDEKKSHFALWASFSAPLIISADVPNLSPDIISYLTNKDIIAVDQDPLGLQATLVSKDGTFDVLTKSLSNGDRLLTVLNRGNHTASTSISLERIGLSVDSAYIAKDLWTGSHITVQDAISITLSRHATAIYRFIDTDSVMSTGMIFNTASLHCLTASTTTLHFENCTGTDSQVWQVTSQGLIGPLSDPSTCIAAENSELTLQGCDTMDEGQRWLYLVTGNLVNDATKECLVEKHSKGNIETCGDELESQVFGLPSGVEVIRASVVQGLVTQLYDRKIK